ncbi:hypothetical protein RUND412_000300 [Rhizina undulata]
MSHPYYKFLPSESRNKFRDLDEDDVYASYKDKLSDPTTKNFIVDFGGARQDGGAAWCALDLDSSDAGAPNIEALLKTERPQALRTRWINIFSPHTQQPLVRAIADHYGLTPRHTTLLTAEPSFDIVQDNTQQKEDVSKLDRLLRRTRRGRDVENGGVQGGDVSEMIAMNGRFVQEPGLPQESTALPNHNYMELVKKVWHWHTVEWGGRYICIGFNSLHQMPVDKAKKNGPSVFLAPMQRNNTGSDMDLDSDDEDGALPAEKEKASNPEGIRLWSWIFLCEDGTVVTLHEPLAPPCGSSSDMLKLVRLNMLTVFRSLSQSQQAKMSGISAASGIGLDELPFRKQNVGGTTSAETIESGPSLLFYYLYDDWYSSYPLVIGRGHPYSTSMRKLRVEMIHSAKIHHISQLHHLGRQLAVLKRMYETKKIIIDNVLNHQDNSGTKIPTPRDSGVAQADGSLSIPKNADVHREYVPNRGDPHVLGVPLEPLAVAKFERLRDRIQLYMLGEINDLLAEKNELASMTFNLIALRESKAVEQMTRMTTLLTKFAFVFLPLSLLTGYFSMVLTDLTTKVFWGTAAALVVITILFLWTIGKYSGTVDMGIVWKAFREVWFGWLVPEEERKRQRRKKKDRF